MRPGFERLSVQDRVNLWVEAPDTPMHIMAVLSVDAAPLLNRFGELKLEQICHNLEERLSRVPRLRQVIKPGSLLTGPPIWVDEVGFDIRRHVRLRPLPRPGTEGQLLAAVAGIAEQRLDQSHSPWELWLLSGLPDGSLALVFKLHHVIADGLAAVQLLSSLFDFTSSGVKRAASALPWMPQPGPSRTALMVDNLNGKRRAVQALIRQVKHPVRAWNSLAAGLGSVLTTMQATRAPKTSFNRPVGSQRRLAVMSISLEEAREVAHTHGGKVNDLLLTLVAGGIRTMLVGRGESPDGRTLRAIVPVSQRHDQALGNEVGLMLVSLPIGPLDPSARLRAVVGETQRAKQWQRPQAQMVGWSLLARPGLSRWVSRHQHLVNLFVTNVMGPPVPVYVLGARLREVIPVVTVAGNCPISFAALSYAGRLCIDAVADPEILPDLDRVLSGMKADWSLLTKTLVGAAV